MLRKDDQAELQIVRLLDEGKAHEALERGLAAYGAGLRGFVLQVLRSTADADEAYAAFCEDLWHSLEGGQWQRRCSFLTWARKLAWHAALRRSKARKNQENALSSSMDLAAPTPSTGPSLFGTTMKDELARHFLELPLEDQALLIFRFEEELSFEAIALLLWKGSSAPTKAELARESTRLRVRLTRVKDRLGEQLVRRPDAQHF